MAINDRIRELQNKFVMSNMTHEEQSELLAIAFNLSQELNKYYLQSPELPPLTTFSELKEATDGLPNLES
jgi:hypothetical protein